MLRKVIESMLIIIDITAAFAGLLMMLTESDDMHMQNILLFGGFGIFACAVICAMVASTIHSRKENEKYLYGNRH